MKRLVGIAVALGTLAGPAEAACRATPFPETPKAFLSDFGQRMARAGNADWRVAMPTAKGPMYISTKTDVTIAIQDKGGLVSEVGLLLPNPSEVETARFEAAATYLLAHFSSADEAAIVSGVMGKAREMQKTKQSVTYRNGDTFAFFQYLDGGYYAAIGNMRCD